MLLNNPPLGFEHYFDEPARAEMQFQAAVASEAPCHFGQALERECPRLETPAFAAALPAQGYPRVAKLLVVSELVVGVNLPRNSAERPT